MARHLALVLFSSLVLCGCHGGMNIRGETPADTSCVLTLVDRATGRTANTFTVSGSFKENVLFPGWWAPPMTIVAQCGGKIVRTVENPALGTVDLGKLEP